MKVTANTPETLRLLYRTHFGSFYRFAYRQVHAVQPPDHWHIDYMVGLLDDCLAGRIRRAIVNAPPPHLETFLTTVAWPVFSLGQNPDLKIVVLCETREAAKELDRIARLLLAPDQMPVLFPHFRNLHKQRNLHLSSRGRLIYAVYGKPLNERYIDLIIVDRPVSPTNAENDAFRDQASNWFNADLVPRLNNDANTILVSTPRVHPEDLTRVLRANKGVWRHTEFLSVARDEERWPMPDGSVYTRRKGEALHPARMSRDQLLATLDEIGAVQFSAQYQQDPSVRKEQRVGLFFLEEYDDDWCKNWTPESGVPGCAIGIAQESNFIRYHLFGVGPPPPEYARPLLTSEQWEQAAMLQQRRLIESHAND